MKTLFAFCLWLASAAALAQIDQAKPVDSHQTFGDYTVHYSVFNSTFITPEVARIHKLARAKNRVLVNVSLTQKREGASSLGLPARVSGTATNLIQQQRPLEFITVSEGEATYYLASLRHTNEEVINFVVNLQPEGSSETFTVRFTRTLHVEP